MASFLDVNVRTNIITFINPSERLGAVIGTNHRRCEEYYQGIIAPSDLMHPETYRIPTEDPIELLKFAMKCLSVDKQREVFKMFVGKSGLFTDDCIEIFLKANWITLNDVKILQDIANPEKLLECADYWRKSEERWADGNRFKYVRSIKSRGKLTQACFDAIAKSKDILLCEDIDRYIESNPVLIWW